MTAVVAMPWRSAPDRVAAHVRVLEYWAAQGIPVVEADGDPVKDFQLSSARNNAVCAAEIAYPSADLIIADADTIPERAAINEALGLLDGNTVVYPFTAYVLLPAEAATTPNLVAVDPIGDPYSDSVGGVLVTDFATYWRLGGMDERFERRWGFEDNAFASVAQTLATVKRVTGRVYSFDHKVIGPGRCADMSNPNYWRYKLYRACLHQPEMMRELLK